MARFFGSWVRDIGLSWRGLVQRPGFAALAVASLALGIGANALVFSVVNGVVLQPLAYPDADRLVAVWLTPPNEPEQRFGTNTGVFFTLRDNNTSFESLGAGRLNETATITVNGDPTAHWMPSQWFSADLVRTLGVEPLLGHWPDDASGVAISYGLWQRMFGGSPSVLGTTVDFGVATAVIEAVMPEGFFLLDPDTDLWLYQADENLSNALRSPNRLFTLVGRLRPGVTVAQAQAEMDAMAQVVSRDFPETHAGWGLKVEPLRDAYIGGVRDLLWVFQGAVFFVLLIACSNVGALVLSRAAARQKELAIRSALGSSRWRLVRQLLTDNLLLSCLGAVLGIGVAWVGVRLLVASGIEGLPRLAEVVMDWRVVAVAAATALGTGVVFGALPGIKVSRPNVAEVLRGASRGTTEGVGQQRFRAAFVVAQVALALVILIASSLMVRSFSLINAAGVGFNPANLTVLDLPFPRTYSRNTGRNTTAGGLLVEFDERFSQDSEALLERLSSLAGVRSVAATATPPLGGVPPRAGIRLEGEALSPAEQTARSAEWYPVSSGYFDALELPVLRGRAFDAGDRLDSRPVAVVSTAMAERFWPGEDPIGQRLQTDVVDDPVREVVGVVADVRQDRYQRVPPPQLYVPRLQVPRRMDNALALRVLRTAVVVRTDGRVSGIETALRSAVQEALPFLPIASVRSVEDYAAGQVQELRRATVLLSTFGLIAVALALIGIFGVVTHLVRQRRTEIGIRMALGARRERVLSLILRQGVALIAVGLVVGALGAFALTRLVRGFLYGVTATDPLSFAAAMLALAAVGLLACYLPARAASRIDPMVSLRSE